MLTFKEALCLLAIVIAYGITGRMDYEDALLMEQVRPQVGADCILPLAGDDTLSELGPTGHPPVVRPQYAIQAVFDERLHARFPRVLPPVPEVWTNYRVLYPATLVLRGHLDDFPGRLRKCQVRLVQLPVNIATAHLVHSPPIAGGHIQPVVY